MAIPERFCEWCLAMVAAKYFLARKPRFHPGSFQCAPSFLRGDKMDGHRAGWGGAGTGEDLAAVCLALTQITPVERSGFLLCDD